MTHVLKRMNRSMATLGRIAGPVKVGICLPLILIASASFAENTSMDADTGRTQLWVDMYSGEPLPFPAVVEDLRSARVVYLGERHRLKRHHKLQEEIIDSLATGNRKLVVGLEQMERRYQPQLDRYSNGEIDFETLCRETEREIHWSGFEQYRGVLESARRAKAKLLALNIDRAVIRAVAISGGIEKLDSHIREQLPAEIPTHDPLYEKWLSLVMPVHAGPMADRLRPMIEAQMARDEAMAESLGRYLLSPEGKGRSAVVICGSGHVNYGMGTVSRVRRRMPGIVDRIVLFSESGDVKLTEAERAQSRPVRITHEQLRALRVPIADYLQVTSLADEAGRP